MRTWIAAILTIGLSISSLASSQILHGIIAHAQHATQPPSGPTPVASYNFDVDSSTIADRTGNGHTGTCTICPVWGATSGRNSTGAFTWAKTTNQVISVDGATLDLHSANAFTIAFDTNITSINITGQSFYRSSQFSFFGQLFSNHRYEVTDPAITGTPLIISTDAEFDGAWHHVAMVFDGTAGTWTLFVDSVQSVQQTGLGGTLGSNANDVLIGGLTGAASGFEGTIDNVRIYAVALTVSEIGDIDGVDVPD